MPNNDSRHLSWLRAWVLLMLLAATPALAAEVIGVVLAFSGQANIVHAGQKRPASQRAELFSGDSIITGEGQAQLRFSDGTLLSLYRNTRFAVDDYQYSKGSDDKARFSLVNGLMHTLTGQMDKPRYQLKTRLANLGVRGTEYSAQLDEELRVSVDQGSVLLSNAAGSLEIGAGGSAVVTSANSIPRPPIGGRIELGHAGGPGGAGAPGMSPPPPPPPPGTAKF